MDENLPALITRFKAELAQARETRNAIEKVGQSSTFGGASFARANYESVNKRIRQLERDLFNAEAARDGTDAEWGTSPAQFSTL